MSGGKKIEREIFINVWSSLIISGDHMFDTVLNFVVFEICGVLTYEQDDRTTAHEEFRQIYIAILSFIYLYLFFNLLLNLKIIIRLGMHRANNHKI